MHTLCGCMQVLPLAGCVLVGGWARGLPPLLPPPWQGKLTLCPICRVSGTTPGLAASMASTEKPLACDMPQNVSPGWMVWVPQPAAQHHDIRGGEAPGVQEMERTALLGAAAQSVGQGADRLVCGPSRRQEVHDSHDQGCSTVNQPQLSIKIQFF